MKKWMQGNQWYIRNAADRPVRLNSEDGADYVLNLQAQLEILEDKISRLTTRKKPGPRETK